jgi:hypothetical protein
MAKSTKIKWPPPPERNASHQYVGVRAVELLAEYQRVKGKKAKFARREELVIKAEALDLIEIMGAPWRLTELFDIMLGGPRSQVFYMQDAYPWVAEVVDYEARAHEEGRVLTNTEITDCVVMPARKTVGSRQDVMSEVRELRKTDRYAARVVSRRYYLKDNPETLKK